MDTVEESVAAYLKLWVDPDGTVRECEVVAFEGDPQSAQTLCTGALGAPLKSARDPDGKKVHGVVTTAFSASPKNKPPIELMNALRNQILPADLVFAVNYVPDRPRVAVRLLVDEAGSVAHCEPGRGAPDQWTRVVCNQATTMKFDARISHKNEPVRYVRGLVVEFESDGSGTAPG